MMKTEIDWEDVWKVFWARYAREGPKLHELQRRVGMVFKETWRKASPATGIEEPIVISFDKEGTLHTSMGGWVLIGAIAAVAAADSMNKLNDFRAVLDNSVTDLDRKWYKMQEIEDRLQRLEMWWGLDKEMGKGK